MDSRIVTNQDIPMLGEYLKSRGTVTFSYSRHPDDATTYLITITGPIRTINHTPWGGSPNGMYLVALRLTGANYFDLREPEVFTTEYVLEKLTLRSSDDAIAITNLLNNLRRCLV